jgi:hypothetical protein
MKTKLIIFALLSVTPRFYSNNCADDGKIIPSSTHNPVGQIIETRYIVKRK